MGRNGEVMNVSSLGSRMKFYETFGNTEYLMPLLPCVVRLDGNNFHAFTKGLKRPFDERLCSLMQMTTQYLVTLTGAVIGYTQSDEITLILYSDNIKSQIYFDGKPRKINSILSSKCTTFFQKNLPDYIPEKAKELPVFDCRCHPVPEKYEAVNNLIWREMDATRNSIQMTGQANFSHTELQNKNCNQIQEMLFQKKGINWNDLPNYQKRGSYFQNKTIKRKFTEEELKRLPEWHEAKTDDNFFIERKKVVMLDLPILKKIINRNEVVFNGDEPIVDEDE